MLIDNPPFVSVLLPVRNEEAFIGPCVESILAQDYPLERMEIIFVDGRSQDRTVALLNEYAAKVPQIRVLDNPDRTVPYAMNIAIRASVGELIVRLDAHAIYPADYISRSVHTLLTQDCDNAGGLFITRGKGYMGTAIAGMLSTFFGVGNAQFRLETQSGYVDTVPFGTFRRSLFDKIGLYDERLTRNQDNELNYRIRKNGGKVYLDTSISCQYYCRDTLPKIMKMGFLNGAWNVVTMALCPGAMGVRHFVPMAFVLFLLLMPILCALTGSAFLLALLLLGLGVYLLLDGFYSYTVAEKIGWKYLPVLPIIYPAFHVAYGLGSMRGVAMLPRFLRSNSKKADRSSKEADS